MKSIEEILREQEKEQENEVVSTYGYTYKELSEIFDKIANSEDWKAPILVSCPGESVIAICEAIKFFTATVPQVTLNPEKMVYVIYSEGYRNGPAGDH